MTVYLDALEGEAGEILERQKGTGFQGYMLVEPATINALIAELKEARGLLQRWRSDLPTETLEDLTDAFLARNGEGEG